MNIIAKTIKDERLIKLLRQMLQAGYMEDWRYNRTYSGTPQGNALSPLLANIFLNELDKFVETILIPQYTTGKKRKNNPRYSHQQSQIAKAKRHGDQDLCRRLAQELRTIPSMDNYDENFRRLKYIRYADDFLIGFIGPKSEAEDIKQKIGEFLVTLGLTLSPEKTLITHAHKQRTRFLGYDIHVAIVNTKQYQRRRTINGKVMLSVPQEVIQEWFSRHRKNGKPRARTSLIQYADYDIVMKYQLELRGLVNYYKLAYNVSKLHRVKSSHLQSLVKTLASKHKKSARWVYRRYYSKQSNGLKALVVKVHREGK